MIAAETNEELRRAVAQLPPAARECLRLRFWHDVPVAETAAAMGCPVGTIKARQHHALRRVARLLPDDSEPPPPQPDTTDPLIRARHAVTEVGQHQADQTQQAEQDRARQLARWHTDDQTGAHQAHQRDRHGRGLGAEGGTP